MRALISAAEAAGVWTLQAGIFPENEASIRLHTAEGFASSACANASASWTVSGGMSCCWSAAFPPSARLRSVLFRALGIACLFSGAALLGVILARLSSSADPGADHLRLPG